MFHNTFIEVFFFAAGVVSALRSFYWLGKNIEKFAVDEYHHALIKHSKAGHKGSLERCMDTECLVVMNTEFQTT